MMFWTDIARLLQYFRNLFNSFINIFTILQDFNEIFSKYSFNITALCGIFPLRSDELFLSKRWLPIYFTDKFLRVYHLKFLSLVIQIFFPNTLTIFLIFTKTGTFTLFQWTMFIPVLNSPIHILQPIDPYKYFETLKNFQKFYQPLSLCGRNFIATCHRTSLRNFYSTRCALCADGCKSRKPTFMAKRVMKKDYRKDGMWRVKEGGSFRVYGTYR